MSNASAERANLLRSFLEDDPLYRPLELRGGFSSDDEWPDRITLWCGVDSGPRPFKDTTGGYVYNRPAPGFRVLEYECTECQDYEARFLVYGFLRNNEASVGYLEKVGQYPPFDIETPGDMRKFLGTSETFYKKGLISLSQGFGLGALAYMRRVVEDKARDILLLLAEIQEAEGAAPDEVQEMRELAEGRQVAPILKRSAQLLPKSLRPGGENPLARIYDVASGGIHSGPEDQAIDKAMAIRVALEYVVPRLQQQIDGKQAYLDAMRDLNEKADS